MDIAITSSHDTHAQRNSGLIVKEHFTCGTFSYHDGFVNEKLVQRSRSSKYTRSIQDGFYQSTSIMFQPGGKQSTRFPPVGPVELHVLVFFVNRFLLGKFKFWIARIQSCQMTPSQKIEVR